MVAKKLLLLAMVGGSAFAEERSEARRLQNVGFKPSDANAGVTTKGLSLADRLYFDFAAQEASAEGTTPKASTIGESWKDGSKLLTQVVANTFETGDKHAADILATVLAAVGYEISACSQYFCEGWLPMEQYPILKESREVKTIRPLYRVAEQAGSVVSEALQSLRVDSIRQNLDPTLDGTGMRVGILSTSFNTNTNAPTNYADDVASGDLPSDVTILKEFSGVQSTSDDGRAMAQLIYDLIPGVEISFYTAFEGIQDFADGIQALADDGCDVIFDDIVYFFVPFFQDGIIAQSANSVARDRNIPYFSSAGNRANKSWEGGPFSASGSVDDNGCELHDFSPDSSSDFLQNVGLPAGSTLVLQWDDPWASISGLPGAASDVDLYLIAEDGVTIVDSDIDIEIGGDAFAVVRVPSDGLYSISISICNGPPPTKFKWMVFGASSADINIIEYDTMSSTSFGHSNQPFTAGVGASFFQQTPFFGQNPPLLEQFSSAGGTPILFETDGSRKVSPEVRMQPRFVATDGVKNTFFGAALSLAPNGPGFYYFGTSAATPNAAAVALLILQVNPSLAPMEVYEIMQTTAIDMNDPGFDFSSGFGYINALAAVTAAQATTDPPAVDPTEAPVLDPTNAPIPDPTEPPVLDPTNAPILDPTEAPVLDPTNAPIPDPTEAPVMMPTGPPSEAKNCVDCSGEHVTPYYIYKSFGDHGITFVEALLAAPEDCILAPIFNIEDVMDIQAAVPPGKTAYTAVYKSPVTVLADAIDCYADVNDCPVEEPFPADMPEVVSSFPICPAMKDGWMNYGTDDKVPPHVWTNNQPSFCGAGGIQSVGAVWGMDVEGNGNIGDLRDVNPGWYLPGAVYRCCFSDITCFLSPGDNSFEC